MMPLPSDDWTLLESLTKMMDLDPHYFKVVIIQFLFCMACYIKFIPFAYRSNPGYIRLKPIEKAEWKTRVMSNWNSVISTLLCCAGLMFDHQMWTDPVYYKSPWVLYAISLASGYFWADLCMISYFGIEPLTPIVVHHLLAGIGFLIGLGPIGRFSFFGAFLLLTEVSTFFNNYVWWYEKQNQKETGVYKTYFALFTITWVFFRLINWFFIFGYSYLHWQTIRQTNIVMQSFLLMNYVFLSLLNYSYFFVLGPFLPYYLSTTTSSTTSKSLKNGKKNGAKKSPRKRK